jgi:hypothetical protein
MVAAVAVVAIIAAIIFVPDMVASPQDLLEQDKYYKAYLKAPDDQKSEIFTGILDDGQYEIAFKLAGDDEKLLLKAIGCAIGLNHFDWAYANVPTDDMKLQVLAANAAVTAIPEIQDMVKDGNSVRLTEAYCMYDDTFYSFDSYSEKLEKLFDNLTRDYIRDVLSDSDAVEVPSAFIDGVNKLIEDGKVDEVELINGGSVSDGGVTA